MNRYLITTADERSWVFDRPVLFLGEWCRRYDRKHIWSKMDATVAEPYGVENSQKVQNLDYVQYIVEQLLIELTDALNEFHQTEHDQRYWNIVLGHWLRRFVAVMFNRYHVIEQVLSKYKIAGTTVFEAIDYSLATDDSLAFIWACNDNLWNHVIFSKILDYKGEVEQNLDPLPLKGMTGFSSIDKRPTIFLRSPSRIMRNLASKISVKLSRNTDAFIISSFLPLREAIKLHLSLGQMPQLWKSAEFMPVKPELEQRLKLNILSTYPKTFETYIRLQLVDAIPTCYLEGYDALLNKSKTLNWPKKPKFIFTSNNFDTDEMFKIWLGSKVNQGVPYFVGQHGNNYGTLPSCVNCTDLITCDKFLTWGWSSENKKTLPAFIFKTAGRKKATFNPSGGLLLIQLPPPHWLGPADNYFEYGLYQDEQFRFADSLPSAIYQKLIVRLHHNYKDFSWHDEQRWRDYDSAITLEPGDLPIEQLIAKSRLVVHSYDSTGLLETLSLNIPTICFWNHGTDHLVPEAKPFYQLLKQVGILHDTPEQAAALIARNWKNLDDWWNTTELQETRKIFCNQYAKVVRHPVKTLKRILQAEMI